MILRRWTNPRLSKIACWIAIAMVAVVVRWQWDRLIAPQTPMVQSDTRVFQNIAELPFGLDLVSSSKPLVVPLVFRAAHNDSRAITRFQAEVAFVAWGIVTATIVLVLRRRWTRALAIGIGVCFLLEPTRVGFASALMPESLNDSLMALSIAAVLTAFRLRGRARVAASIATGVLVLVWLFTRDTNVFIALAATAMAMVVWHRWRSRLAWVIAVAIIAVSSIVLWSTTVAHEPLPYQRGWYVAFTPRNAYPMLDNIVFRVAPDDPDELPETMRQYTDPMPIALAGPEARPLQAWLAEHGSAVYARWLVRRPLDRVRELLRGRWHAFAPQLSSFMPVEQVRPSTPIRTLTSNRWLLTVLLLASPLLLWRWRADPLVRLVLCIVLSGVVGTLAAYYGDAREAARHCYGAGQQVVLGLFLAGLARMDRTTWPRSVSPPPA